MIEVQWKALLAVHLKGYGNINSEYLLTDRVQFIKQVFRGVFPIILYSKSADHFEHILFQLHKLNKS